MRYLVLLLGLCMMGCGNQNGLVGEKRSDEANKHGIYYWKTVFDLSDWDKNFLREHDVERIYLRLFDVAYEYDNDGAQKSVPVATVRFKGKIPDRIEIVPVVYITQEAIRNDPDFHELLYKRIKAMAAKHGFTNLKEIQLDCDWTRSTRDKFFGLCQHMRALMLADSVSLSATIRLHQLKDSVPPVDRGVLMLYNTGSIYDPETENSILSYDDVAPYLKTEISYKLPLSLAYPAYSWGIAMRDDKFMCILHQTDFSDDNLYRYTRDSIFEVRRYHDLEGHAMSKGDLIRLERPSFNEIEEVRNLAIKQIVSPIESSIIYHLDSMELSRFTSEEIDKILR